MAAPARHFRLAPDHVTEPPQAAAPQRLGLTCGPDGPALAGAPLLRKTATGLEPLPEGELAALTLAAYGEIPDLTRLTRGLAAAAKALNRGDLPLAQTAAVHLELQDVTPEGAARVAAVADHLAKAGTAEKAPADRIMRRANRA